MFMGIDVDGWMQLWNGVIGAALSAVLAALVAVFVVWRTNKHQSSLAETALAAQREDAATALKVQRDLLERQIREQREESRRAEKTRALSEYVAGVRELGATHDKTDILEIGATCRRLEAALASLDILGGEDEGLYDLLHPSIKILRITAIHCYTDFQLEMNRGALAQLQISTSAICLAAPKWWSGEQGIERASVRKDIEETLESTEHFNQQIRIMS